MTSRMDRKATQRTETSKNNKPAPLTSFSKASCFVVENEAFQKDLRTKE